MRLRAVRRAIEFAQKVVARRLRVAVAQRDEAAVEVAERCLRLQLREPRLERRRLTVPALVSEDLGEVEDDLRVVGLLCIGRAQRAFGQRRIAMAPIDDAERVEGNAPQNVSKSCSP